MSNISAFFWFFIIRAASKDVQIVQKAEGGWVTLTFNPEGNLQQPIGFLLQHMTNSALTDVLFLSADGGMKEDLRYQKRVHIGGNLSAEICVTLSHLEPSDSGLYTGHFTSTHVPDDHAVHGTPGHFLHVQSSEEPCHCSSYAALLYSSSALAGVVLLVLVVATAQCVQHKKMVSSSRELGGAPIYEEMRAGRQENPAVLSLTEQGD